MLYTIQITDNNHQFEACVTGTKESCWYVYYMAAHYNKGDKKDQHMSGWMTRKWSVRVMDQNGNHYDPRTGINMKPMENRVSTLYFYGDREISSLEFYKRD